MGYIFRGFDAVGNKGWVYGDLVHNKKVTDTGLEDRVMVGGYEVVPDSVSLWNGIDMDKDDLAKLVMEEWDKGNIMFQSIEGLNKCKLEDFVKQPLEGQMYDINRDLLTILAFINEKTWINNYACARLVEYYYERCKDLEGKLKEIENEGR